MRQSIFMALALAVALMGTASAEAIFRHIAPTTTNGMKVAAGTVNSDGTVAAGSGFTVSHIATGQYKIVFDHGYFTACAAMTVTNTQLALLPVVSENRCTPANRFMVVLWVQNCACMSDGGFQFTAIQESS